MPGQQLAVADDVVGHRLPRGLTIRGPQRLQDGPVVAGGGRRPAADGRVERPGGAADRALDEPVDYRRIGDLVDRQVKLGVELFDAGEIALFGGVLQPGLNVLQDLDVGGGPRLAVRAQSSPPSSALAWAPSRMSLGDNDETMNPRRGATWRSPSVCSCSRPSRTGVALMPSVSATASGRMNSPPLSCPVTIRSRTWAAASSLRRRRRGKSCPEGALSPRAIIP